MDFSNQPLRVMIAGAPASGKGTQCAKIVEKYGLIHISVGVLLRAEVAAGTPAGKKAQSFMDSGALVPDEVVVEMVKNKLAGDDATTKGWLLDGYPRSGAQAEAIEAVGIRPDVFLLVNVPDDMLVERVVGRRSDPVTGEIYHLKFKPPPADIVSRLVQRSDDSEAMVRNRLETYHTHVGAITGHYKDVMVEIDGNRSMNEVFTSIEAAISLAPFLGGTQRSSSFSNGGLTNEPDSFQGSSSTSVPIQPATPDQSLPTPTPLAGPLHVDGPPLRIIIAGPPASGKGTQSSKIVEKYGLVHISVGDLLRAEVAASTPAGRKAKSFVDSGALVPDEVVVEMVKNKLNQPEVTTKGWLLDGYPRSNPQALAIEAVGIRPDIFLVIVVPEDQIVERVTGRRSDPVTGEIYHLKFKPPPTNVISRLLRRPDDIEALVRNRLETYHKHMDAMVCTYRDIMVEIPGNQSIDDVFQSIEAAIATVPELRKKGASDGRATRRAVLMWEQKSAAASGASTPMSHHGSRSPVNKLSGKRIAALEHFAALSREGSFTSSNGGSFTMPRRIRTSSAATPTMYSRVAAALHAEHAAVIPKLTAIAAERKEEPEVEEVSIVAEAEPAAAEPAVVVVEEESTPPAEPAVVVVEEESTPPAEPAVVMMFMLVEESAPAAEPAVEIIEEKSAPVQIIEEESTPAAEPAVEAGLRTAAAPVVVTYVEPPALTTTNAPDATSMPVPAPVSIPVPVGPPDHNDNNNNNNNNINKPTDKISAPRMPTAIPLAAPMISHPPTLTPITGTEETITTSASTSTASTTATTTPNAEAPPVPSPVLKPQDQLSPTGKPLKVMVAGAPASGKGTQCAKIVAKYGLVHISVGELLREEVASGTVAGMRAKSFMDSGALVPDDVVVEMVIDKLNEPDVSSKGWLLDGYPRSGEQAEAFEAVGITPDVFLLINVPDEKIVERVVGRRGDPVTGEIYHLKFKPPPAEISHRLVQRSDDTEEMVRNRLETYHKHVNAVLECYRDYVVEIGGDKSMEEVFLGIETAIAIAPLLKPRPRLVLSLS